MDSRTAFRGSVVSKRLVAILLIVMAAIAGMTGAFVLRQLLPGATVPAVSTVTFAHGSAWDDKDRKHGTQTVGGVEVSPADAPDPGGQTRGTQY